MPYGRGICFFVNVDFLHLFAYRHYSICRNLYQYTFNNLKIYPYLALTKKDSKTYFRAEMYGGEKLNTISPLCTAAIERDADAFSALMEHIRKTDQNTTVIMVQVENEVGLLGTERLLSAVFIQSRVIIEKLIFSEKNQEPFRMENGYSPRGRMEMKRSCQFCTICRDVLR